MSDLKLTFTGTMSIHSDALDLTDPVIGTHIVTGIARLLQDEPVIIWHPEDGHPQAGTARARLSAVAINDDTTSPNS